MQGVSSLAGQVLTALVAGRAGTQGWRLNPRYNHLGWSTPKGKAAATFGQTKPGHRGPSPQFQRSLQSWEGTSLQHQRDESTAAALTHISYEQAGFPKLSTHFQLATFCHKPAYLVSLTKTFALAWTPKPCAALLL